MWPQFNNNNMKTAIILLAVILVIGIMVTASKEKEKERQEQERAKQRKKEEEEETQRVLEARRKLIDQIADSEEEDKENARQMQNSTLGHYTFKVKGLYYRSDNSKVGSLFLRKYCTLHLEPEPDNEHDSHAMRVYSDDGNFFLGYVEAGMSFALSAVYPHIKSCFISDYEEGPELPYITATAYFQKVIDGVPQPYTLGTKKMDMPSEINTDNTVATFRSYISKALKKEDWNEKTFNEVQARANFLLSNGIKMSERVKEELRARGVKLKEIGEF